MDPSPFLRKTLHPAGFCNANEGEGPQLPFLLQFSIVVQVCVQPVCAMIEGGRTTPRSTVGHLSVKVFGPVCRP